MASFAPTQHDDCVLSDHPQSRARWVNVVTHLDAKYGGLSAVVPELSWAVQAAGNTEVRLSAFTSPEERTAPASAVGLHLRHWPTARRPWIFGAALRTQFDEEIRGADGVHIHGLWEQSTAVAAASSRRLGKPYIVSAHGMLERWALANRRWKKRIYAGLIERRNLQSAACLHALTRTEAQDYRSFGCKAPIAIIPNGVHLPESIEPERFFTLYPELRGRRILLFLGRIHPKKGLDLLAEAWAEVAPSWPEAHLVIAGPDFEQTRPALEKVFSDRGLSDRVLFPGMLRGEMKWSALAAAECFLLPSYSEGLSVSTLEAMGAGLPVIVTRACNLPEVSEFGAGWEIQSNTVDLTSVLGDLLRNPIETNREIGQRGRALVKQRFSWEAVGAQMSELYHWVLGGPDPLLFEVNHREGTQ